MRIPLDKNYQKRFVLTLEVDEADELAEVRDPDGVLADELIDDPPAVGEPDGVTVGAASGFSGVSQNNTHLPSRA